MHGISVFFLSTLCIECCQIQETLGIFTEHYLVDYNSSRVIEIEPFCFKNKLLRGFQGFYIRCEEVQWGRPDSMESKAMVF